MELASFVASAIVAVSSFIVISSHNPEASYPQPTPELSSFSS
jgi:hypothetical protein